MAKRFTETNKWQDPWYRKLPCKYRDLWQYILDNCDNSGIWVEDIETAQYFIGESINAKEAIELFNHGKERIKIHNFIKWEILEFIEFQFGILKATNPLHTSICNIIEKHISRGISGVFKGYSMPYGKGKGKGIGKGEREEYINNIYIIVSDLNTIIKSSYKPTSQKTKDLIVARLNEGFSVDDFKTVHRKMAKAWGADNKMRQYLRPQTLYGTKFESYLNRPDDLPMSDAGAKTAQVAKEWLQETEGEDVE